MVCDAGAHRHRRKHPLPMSADYRQTHSRALFYPLLSTEKTISRPMAYSGKNPLSRICLFNCRKSGTPHGKPEACHRHDPNHSGPLQGMEGAIRKIDRHKRIAVLSLDMFGRTVDMKVGLEIIEKNKDKNTEAPLQEM